MTSELTTANPGIASHCTGDVVLLVHATAVKYFAHVRISKCFQHVSQLTKFLVLC